MPRESSVEAWVVRLARELGGEAYKLTGYVGIPDRLVLLPNAIVFFVETKNETGRLSKAQRMRHRFLRALGFAVHVPRTREDVGNIFEEHGYENVLSSRKTRQTQS